MLRYFSIQPFFSLLIILYIYLLVMMSYRKYSFQSKDNSKAEHCFFFSNGNKNTLHAKEKKDNVKFISKDLLKLSGEDTSLWQWCPEVQASVCAVGQHPPFPIGDQDPPASCDHQGRHVQGEPWIRHLPRPGPTAVLAGPGLAGHQGLS